MFCKHCGAKIPKDKKVCPDCGKSTGSDLLKIVLAVAVGVLVVAALVFMVYVGTYGWPSTEDPAGSTTGQPTSRPTEVPGTTPTDGNPDDVSCKGSYTGDKSQVESEKNTVIATMGNYELTNGQLQVYYWMEVIDFLNRYGSYAAYFGLDYTKPLDQQLYDKETGRSWQQFFLEGALNNWHHDHALYLEAEKVGYVMGKDYQEYLDGLYETMLESATKNGFVGVDAMLQSDLGAGADYQGYIYYMMRYYKGNLYLNDSYSKVPVTLKEIEEYYEKNKEVIKQNYKADKNSGLVADVQFLMFYPEGATAETLGKQTFDEAAWEAARAKAQAVLDKWVSEGATAEGFQKLIEEYGKETNKGGGAGQQMGLPQFDMAEVDVRHILLIPENGTKDENGNTVYSEADWEACRAKAQAMLDEWIAKGAKEADFIELAKQHSKDGNAKDGGIYTNVTKNYMVETFDAWIFDASRQYGDYGLVKTPYGYHLMFFVHADREVDNWIFDKDTKAGDYTLVKTDYGYYVLRLTAEKEEGWVRYSRESLQAEKLTNEALETYPLTVYYEKILLWQASLG